MPERGSGAGWDIRHLFSPPSRATEGREDPHTEPHAPAHGAPGNPTPITMEDMSDQEGVGSASDPEATLTHPSARDSRQEAEGRRLERAQRLLVARPRAVKWRTTSGYEYEFVLVPHTTTKWQKLTLTLRVG